MLAKVAMLFLHSHLLTVQRRSFPLHINSPNIWTFFALMLAETKSIVIVPFIPTHLIVPFSINYRTCELRNLCFDLKQNDFFWLPIRRSGANEDVVGLRGGIYGHVFPLNVGPSRNETPSKDELVITIESPTLFFLRFVANNLFHVIHDDIFPLLLLIASHKKLREAPTSSNRLLIYADAHPLGKYAPLYELLGPFSGIKIFLERIRNENPQATKLCFRNLFMGPIKSSLWFPMRRGDRFGPSRLFNPNEIGESVNLLANWFRKRLNKPDRHSYNLKTVYRAHLEGIKSDLRNALAPKICIVTRKQSRITVNQGFVVQSLQEAFPSCQVAFLEDEDSPKIELLREVMGCFALIAAHGALLSMTAFIPEGGMLYEVFPFGLYHAEAVQVYKALVDLPGMRIHYRNAHSPLLEDGHEKAEQAIAAKVPPSYAYGVRMAARAPNFTCCSNVFQVYKLAQNIEINTVHLISSLREMMQEELKADR
jgi:hypothetical protein